jgi:pimeloyl-ACP methyl ester carboxylesterase
MVEHCSKWLLRRCYLVLLLLAAAGCSEATNRLLQMTTAPSGFSADTFSREGLMSGATTTETACRALPDGLWVSAGDRHECLRYAQGGTLGSGRTALIYVPGDPGGASYGYLGGIPVIQRASEYYELSPETRDYGADALSGAMGGMPVILMARPGMHGSSGNHARDRHSKMEVALLNDALTQLQQRYRFAGLTLFGFSSGGAIVANLLSLRTDIRCAVIGSAPLDFAQYYRRQDGQTSDYFAAHRDDLADPMRSVGSIQSNADIFVIGDRRDRNVPADAWELWVAAAKRAGLHAFSAEVAGSERTELGGSIESHHHTASRGMEIAHACATGVPADRLLQALRSGTPILQPKGRRLSGPEIVAVFGGRSLRATEWFPRRNVLSRWREDGVVSYFDLYRGERRLADWRWRVENDHLCTTRHGCGEVLSDGRFLHLVRGEPLQLRVTFVTAPPGLVPQNAERR